ncbi:hypothetical protein CDD83_704 [Cordyceps sp. RAO-2017]|nr:hypothetical protein CDD83_704 [Cordyceps sp. RAO-2017]
MSLGQTALGLLAIRQGSSVHAHRSALGSRTGAGSRKAGQRDMCPACLRLSVQYSTPFEIKERLPSRDSTPAPSLPPSNPDHAVDGQGRPSRPNRGPFGRRLMKPSRERTDIVVDAGHYLPFWTAPALRTYV